MTKTTFCVGRTGGPALTIVGGGRGTGAHALEEAFDATECGRTHSARCCS